MARTGIVLGALAATAVATVAVTMAGQGVRAREKPTFTVGTRFRSPETDARWEVVEVVFEADRGWTYRLFGTGGLGQEEVFLPPENFPRMTETDLAELIDFANFVVV